MKVAIQRRSKMPNFELNTNTMHWCIMKTLSLEQMFNTFIRYGHKSHFILGTSCVSAELLHHFLTCNQSLRKLQKKKTNLMKGHGFNQNRFHVCIFIHLCWGDFGQENVTGEKFIIPKKNIHPWVTSKRHHLSLTFSQNGAFGLLELKRTYQ